MPEARGPFRTWNGRESYEFVDGVRAIQNPAFADGFDHIALCAGAILAFPALWRARLTGAAGGIALILLVNTVRIGTLGRAARQFHTYPAGSPLCTEAVDACHRAFTALEIDHTLGFRVSAWGRRDGGWIDRVDYQSLAVTDKNANRADTYALRGALTRVRTASIACRSDTSTIGE